MKAKDTAMSEEELNKAYMLIDYHPTFKIVPEVKAGLESAISKQAEISFKAGEEYAKEGHEAISYLEGYQIGKKVGIREVVEYIEELIIGWDCAAAIDIRKEDWQEQLKEWGIDG